MAPMGSRPPTERPEAMRHRMQPHDQVRAATSPPARPKPAWPARNATVGMTVACNTRGPAWRTMRPTRGNSAVAGWFGRRDIGRAGCDGGSVRTPLLLSAPDHPYLKHSQLKGWGVVEPTSPVSPSPGAPPAGPDQSDVPIRPPGPDRA